MSAATVRIERASLFVMATYPDDSVNRLRLEHWAARAASGERRQLEPMHDSLTVLHRVNAPDSTEIRDLRVMEEFAATRGLPTDDQQGVSRVFLIELSPGGLDDSQFRGQIAEVLRQESHDTAWETLSDGSLVLGRGGDELIWVFEPSQRESCSKFAFGPLRLIESHRHKVLGQFSEYEAAFRRPFMDASAELRQGLEILTQKWQCCNGQTGGMMNSAAAADASHAVTHIYARMLLAQGPVQQIEAMLAANLQNLAAILETATACSCPSVIRQRIGLLTMKLAQVQSDLKFTAPMLNAAQAVTQTFHSQTLADLAESESTENRQRSDEANQRERHNRRLMILGVWLGLNQASTGWAALTEPAEQWNAISLIGLLSLPTIAMAAVWLVDQFFRRNQAST